MKPERHTPHPMQEVTRLATQIQASGCPEIKPEEDYLTKQYAPEEATAVWNSIGKRERYGIHLFFTQRVYQDAQALTSPPFEAAIECMKDDRNDTSRDLDPLFGVSKAFRARFFRATFLLFNRIEEGSEEDQKLLSAYRRATEIDRFAEEHHLPVLTYDQKGAIKIGYDNAIHKMSLAFNNIVHKYKTQFPDKELFPDELVEIARNSFPFLVRSSMVNLKTFGELTEDLMKDPQNLVLESNHEKLQLSYAQHALDEISEYENTEDLEGLTIGCPAMIGGVIKDMWEWYCDTTEEVFEYMKAQDLPITLN